jgi:hypothetical protein
MYGYGTLKPVEVILRSGWGRGRMMERMNQNRYIVSIHGNVTMKPLYNYHIQ